MSSSLSSQASCSPRTSANSPDGVGTGRADLGNSKAALKITDDISTVMGIRLIS